MIPKQAIAVSRLRKLEAAGKLKELPRFRYLYAKHKNSKRRALTDKECDVILRLTEAAVKELRNE
jgi:hypothetical protein